MSQQLLPHLEIETYVLGSLLTKPSIILQTDKYKFSESEFQTYASKAIFKSILSMLFTDYAPSGIQFGVMKAAINSRGSWNDEMERYLETCYEHCDMENFDYYYKEFKKNGLIKELGQEGFLVKQQNWEVNPCYLAQGDKVEDCREFTSKEIMDKLRHKLDVLEDKYTIQSHRGESKASDNIREFVEELRQNPEVGATLQGDIFNSICRGARLGKLYLRSAQSGVGKTRTMVGDACNLAYPIKFDTKLQKWIATGSCEKVLYVMTEQDPEEIKTMILSYLTGINEEHFLYNTVSVSDAAKVEIAMRIMEKYKDNMLFAQIPDPCASVVQNLFRRYAQEGVKYFFYDYIFSSPSMLDEYKSMGVSESVALRMFTTALKNLATELNVFILTSTQISNDSDQKTGGFKDYHQIRGSKAIQDLTDFACIMSRPASEELLMLENACSFSDKTPNLVTDVYKNRRGRWTMVRIWSIIDLGTCRKEDLFMTTANLEGVTNFQLISLKPEISDDCQKETNFYNEMMKKADFKEGFSCSLPTSTTSSKNTMDVSLPKVTKDATLPNHVEDMTSPNPTTDAAPSKPAKKEVPPNPVPQKVQPEPEIKETPPKPAASMAPPKSTAEQTLPESTAKTSPPSSVPKEELSKPTTEQTSSESMIGTNPSKENKNEAPPKKKASVFPKDVKWFWID